MNAPTSSSRKKRKRRLQVRLARTFGPWLFRLISRTWRVRYLGIEHRDGATRDGMRPVFSLWHQHVPSAVGTHIRYGTRVMVSHHHDGSVIEAMIDRLGFSAVRGSSSRGAVAALRAMVRASQDPDALAITPDGPRGPAYEVKPGVLYLASAIKRPLLAVGFASSRHWQSKGWDKMRFPKPFARVVVWYGPAHDLPRAVIRDEEVLAGEAFALRARMEEAQQAAEAELADWRR